MTSPPGGGERAFASDNCAGAHPDALAAVAGANTGHTPAYGADPWTERARELFRAHFGPRSQVQLVFNGTGANVVGLGALLRPWQSVICSDCAHIGVHEAGATERMTGSKLVPVPSVDGRMTPEGLRAAVHGVGDEHAVQPAVVSLTQSTELGTVYQLDELGELTATAHDLGLWVHADGSRLCNAAAALGCSLAEASTLAGIDVLSFGGTKNGLLGADAVVLLSERAQGPAVAGPLPWVRKSATQLASKHRFLAAQFVALLEGDLWHRNAAHANAMAARLAAAVAGLPGVRLTRPVQVNAVFAVLPPRVIGPLREAYPFYVWDERTGECRWVCSWDTTEHDVDAFAALLRRLLG